MGENPSRIDRQITANREHIAATLDAIAYQANIPARLAEQKDALLSDAVALVDSVAAGIDTASRTTAGSLPSVLVVRVRDIVPLAIATLFGMLVGLNWPRQAA